MLLKSKEEDEGPPVNQRRQQKKKNIYLMNNQKQHKYISLKLKLPRKNPTKEAESIRFWIPRQKENKWTTTWIFCV